MDVKIINIFLLIQIIVSINALPYQTSNISSVKNNTWHDLNETMKNFNRNNGSNLKPTEKKKTFLDQIKNIEIDLILNNSTIFVNETVSPIVMNSTVSLNNITLERIDPIIEILQPIQVINQTDVLNETVIQEVVVLDENSTVSFKPLANISNLTHVEELVELDENISRIDENNTVSIRPLVNISIPIAEKLTANLSEALILESNEPKIYQLDSMIKLVYIESFNRSVLSFDPHSIEESIKHSILKYIDSKMSHVCVNLTFNYTIDPKNVLFDDFPILLNLTLKTPVLLSEDQLQNAMVDYSINNKRCTIQNDTQIRCSLFRQKDSSSLLRISDYWIELSQLTPRQQKLNGAEYEIFTYKPAWIVGLAIIGGIIAIFFLGCIVAICYTRRPYRRCGKVYEIESANRKSNQPFIPGVHPTTKASAVTRTKEMYYQ
ncbi:unnamed protein product [Brachionus calyciflorus]|uniref:Uncharacterized protein n=1 Tax=Brachionus calyciflorus TaxID=104777 RepID=A0A813Q4M1_9BILA|nr:unnamed protein product [Brachionus calyciflorus]